MSKNTIITAAEHDAHIDTLIAEIKAENATVTPKAKTPKAKTPKAKTPKTEKTPKELTYDLPAILNAIPDTFTPATLDTLFGLDDGGKTVRRHLRKNFASELEHNLKDKWTFTKAQTNIIEYFAKRYAFKAETN